MKIITVNRIIDDNGKECKPGDQVFLKTTEMDEIVQATIDTIMTTMAVFTIDDSLMGYKPIRVRIKDIVSISLYHSPH